MRGLFLADKKLTYREDLPEPPKRPGELRVRVLRAGICATDLELAAGYMDFRGVPGHEFVGLAAEDGAGLAAGTRVVGEINCPCGRCRTCFAGQPTHCPERSTLGIQGRDGAFAEMLTLPERNLFPLPEGIEDEEAIFVEPLASCFEILNQVHCRPSDRVAVLGDGRLGLIAAQVLALVSGSTILVGRHEERRFLVESWSIGFTDPGRAEPDSFDLVVDCTGSPSGINLAVALARPRGKVVLKSTTLAREPFDAVPAVVKELTLVGSRCGPFPPAIQALEKKDVHVRPLLAGTFPLERGEEAFAAAARPGMLKVQIVVG